MEKSSWHSLSADSGSRHSDKITLGAFEKYCICTDMQISPFSSHYYLNNSLIII